MAEPAAAVGERSLGDLGATDASLVAVCWAECGPSTTGESPSHLTCHCGRHCSLDSRRNLPAALTCCAPAFSDGREGFFDRFRRIEKSSFMHSVGFHRGYA